MKDRTLAITVNRPHGHAQGWAPPEIGVFADQHLKGGKPLVSADWKSPLLRPEAGFVTIPVPRLDPTAPRKVTVRLHWTADVKEPWQKRKWQTVEAEVQVGEKADTHRVTLPESRPLVYFVTFTDERGLTVSSEHASIER